MTDAAISLPAGDRPGVTGQSARRSRMRAQAWHRLWRGFSWAIVCAIAASLVTPQIVVILSAFNDATIVAFPPTGFTVRWFAKALANRDFAAAAVNSAIVAFATAGIAGIAGTLFAYVIERFRFRGRGALEAILGLSLLIPHFTLGLGLLMTAVQLGLTRTYAILVAAHVLLVLPFIMRSVYVSLRNLGGRIPLAAATLGARPLTVLIRIELPLLAPGILSGVLMAAILSFTEFSGSLFLVGRRTETLPVAMYNYIRDYSEPTIAAMAAMMIVAVVALLTIASRFLGLRRILS
jgi:putative spermidine/putrescine transport system permease protein